MSVFSLMQVGRFQVGRAFAGGALALALLAGGCVTAPTEYREPPPLTAQARMTLNLAVHDRVWALVNAFYFDAQFRGVDWAGLRTKYRDEAAAAKDDKALYATLGKLCGELKESHLVALDPRRAHEFFTEHKAGIGIRMRLIDGALVVIDVLPQGPAGRAGVQTGWILRTRNGEAVTDSSTYVARVGVPVLFGFEDRDGQPRDITLQPELLQFDQQVVRELPEGWRYLRFDRFDDASLDGLREALKQQRDGPGVVIDLRFNGGGLAATCELAVADFFDRRVPVGRQVSRTGRSAEMQRRAFFPVNYRGRVIVLTGAATGSAAEIFAHALQWHHRASIVGQRTAGAVIVSRYFALPGGGRLQVPILDFLGLDGQRLEGRGVTPDVVVSEPTLAEHRAGIDPVLNAALALSAHPPAAGVATRPDAGRTTNTAASK